MDFVSGHSGFCVFVSLFRVGRLARIDPRKKSTWQDWLGGKSPNCQIAEMAYKGGLLTTY